MKKNYTVCYKICTFLNVYWNKSTDFFKDKVHFLSIVMINIAWLLVLLTRTCNHWSLPDITTAPLYIYATNFSSQLYSVTALNTCIDNVFTKWYSLKFLILKNRSYQWTRNYWCNETWPTSGTRLWYLLYDLLLLWRECVYIIC